MDGCRDKNIKFLRALSIYSKSLGSSSIKIFPSLSSVCLKIPKEKSHYHKNSWLRVQMNIGYNIGKFVVYLTC